MRKKITINDYEFELVYSVDEPNKIVSSTFKLRNAGPPTQEFSMSKEEYRIGQKIQADIFDGDWDWLIAKTTKTISLDICGITIELVDVEWIGDTRLRYTDGSIRYGGGSITDNLKDVCEACGDVRCDLLCPDALEKASDRDIDIQCSNNEELESSRNHNYACDGVLSMVLGHAVAGLDIESAAYREGLDAAIEGIANNI
jgi:hypothetical protein